MSIPIGNLVIEMAINQARMIKDIEAAKKSIDSSMAGIKKAAETATKALGLVGVALSAAAFAGWIKGAIQVADEANKMSQKVGIATKDVAGLQLAFKQGGVDADGMQKALSKLSVGVLDGNAALKAMGIESRNADGSLKTTREVVGLVADQFATYEDGIAKTKLAIELFGKSGADLIPILNAGGASLDEYDSMAKKLGLTLTDETAASAEKFNDTMELIGMGSKGVATQIAAELLPTLENLSAQFLEFMTQGDGIRITADIIATGLKGIATVAVGTHYALKDLGNVLGSLYEQGVALGSLDFAAIDKIRAQRETDAAKNSADLQDAYDRIWKKSGDASVEAMAKMVGAAKRAAPEIGALADQAKAAADAYAKMIASADALVASIQFETKLLTMNNVEKETAIALQKLATMGIKDGTKEYEKYSEAIIAATLDKAQVQSIIDSNKMIEEARLDAIKKADEAQKKMEEDAAKQISDIGNQVGQSFADALMSGGKNAADYLKDLFRTLVLRPIVQPLISGMVSSVMLGAASAASADTGAATGGSVGGSVGLMHAASSLKNLYDMATGGFASLGASVEGLSATLMNELSGASAAAADLMGSSGGTVAIDAIESLSAASESVAATSSALGAAASTLGGIGAGLGLGNLISGDKSVGGSSWITTGAGTAIGLAVAGPLGAAVGGALGGLVNAAFGSGPKEYTGAGIKGSFSTAGANAMSYRSWEKSGGWFGGGDSGNDYTALTDDVRRTLDAALQGVGVSVSRFVDVLGVKVGSISEFSQDIDLALDGLSPEEINKKISESVTGFADSLTTNLIPEIANFARTGESASATLNRLGTSLSAVNSVMGTLNLKLMDTSLAGASASSALVDLFGTVDSFVSATNYYYQNFYSEQERAAKTTEQLSAVFAQLGVAMPATRDAFRSLVESARAAGNDALFGNLLKLAPAFKDLDTSLANIAQASIQDAQASIQAAQQAAQDVSLADLDRQRTVAQAAKDAAGESVSALKSLFDYLREQVSGILQVADMTMAASNGLTFVSDALAAAKSTGYLPDQASLADAVSAARSGLVSANFGSSYDMRLAQMKLAADLQGLMDITGGRKTIAEQQLEVAEAQLAAIEAQTEVVKAYYAAQLSGATSVRGYASGGNYPGGLAMVGERGPELINFKSPGTVYTASQTQRMLAGGADTAEEVRQLREDSRAQARALVSMQAQMVKYFQRWDSEGLPSTRLETA